MWVKSSRERFSMQHVRHALRKITATDVHAAIFDVKPVGWIVEVRARFLRHEIKAVRLFQMSEIKQDNKNNYKSFDGCLEILSILGCCLLCCCFRHNIQKLAHCCVQCKLFDRCPFALLMYELTVINTVDMGDFLVDITQKLCYKGRDFTWPLTTTKKINWEETTHRVANITQKWSEKYLSVNVIAEKKTETYIHRRNTYCLRVINIFIWWVEDELRVVNDAQVCVEFTRFPAFPW